MSWALAGKLLSKGVEGAAKGTGAALRGANKMGGAAYRGVSKASANISSNPFKMGWKGYAGAYGLTAGMWGVGSVLSSDPSADLSDRAIHHGQYAVAAATDIGVDLGLTIGANAIMGLGPLGLAAGAAVHAYNFLGGFFGADPGSLMLNAMDSMDQMYDRAVGRNSFRMTETTGKAMQRQLQNLQASGTNVAEMMHN